MTDPSQLNELFYQAATLMLVGMAFVYAFLMLMIFVINYIITPIGIKYGQKIDVQKPISINQTRDETSPQVIAAITAAIKRYRLK